MQKPIAWLISGLRTHKTKKMYGLIGGKSPILDITQAQASALEKQLNSSQFTVHGSRSFKVYIGMRYWHPFIRDAVDKILNDGMRSLIVITLYPHYSKATTGSAITEFKRAVSQFTVHGSRVHGSRFTVKYIEQWYDFSPYIDSLAELIGTGISEFKEYDFDVLYSAHGLPEDFIKKGDPYVDQIKATILKVNKRLSLGPYNIMDLKWHLSFQSRTGPVKWLEPTTDKMIIKLANTGCKNLFIVPISFVSDHIETLYEIDILYKVLAMRNGINLKRCQSLNTSEKFIEALKELVMTRCR